MSSGHAETIRDAWRDLLNDKQVALPAVLAKLNSPAWSDNPRGPLAKYFGILLSLLDELDRPAFATEIARLAKTQLHPAHHRTLAFLSQRLQDTPTAWIGQGIPVYVAADLPDHDRLCQRLAHWAKTPGLALDKVTRVDVIADHPDLDYLGLYRIQFSGIVLTWPKTQSRNPVLRWWGDFRREFTFYHEIGHPASGHLEGGSIKEQEDEADAYARAQQRRARPVVTTLLRIALWPVYWVFRLLKLLPKDRS